MVNNPVPTITSLAPQTVYAGSSDFGVTVIGTGFVTSSKAYWNGSERAVYTDSITSTQLTVLIRASDLAAVGSGEINVVNPPPEGGTSTPLTLQIVPTPPIDIRTSQLPATAGGRSYDFTLDIEGSWTPPRFGCSVLAGALPPGLAFDPYVCRIIGTADPVLTDTVFDFTLLATNTSPPKRTGTKDLSITVLSPGKLGRNDTCANATTISNGRIRASISPYGDVDVYSFHGTAGKQVTINIFAQYALDSHDLPFAFASQLDSMLELLDSSCPDPAPNGTNAIAFNDDIEYPDIHVLDSRIPPSPETPSFTLPYTGTYYLRVRDFRGDGRPDLIYELGLWGAD